MTIHIIDTVKNTEDSCLDYEDGYCYRNTEPCKGICKDYVNEQELFTFADKFFSSPEDREFHEHM